MPSTTCTSTTRTSATDRVRNLFDTDRLQLEPVLTDGYLNVLAELPPARTVGARAMRTGFYPVLYERLRPFAFRIASGLVTPGRDGDRDELRDRLSLTAGSTVIDIGCGPGLFTSFLGSLVGEEGLAIGLDTSDTMLAKAVATNSGSSVAYVRGDAERLPFADNSIDAASCLAALYLMNDPYAAIREAARVLKPGGRFAIMTTFSGDLTALRIAMKASESLSGIRSFARHDITTAFTTAGLVDVEQRVHGLTQAVWARKPEASAPPRPTKKTAAKKAPAKKSPAKKTASTR